MLPLLARHLNDQVWVIVDDTRRRDSRRMLERWRTLFADWGFEAEVSKSSLLAIVLIQCRRW